MHKIPSGAKFVAAGKKCINKQLNKHVTSSIQTMLQPNRCISQKNIILVGPKLFK